MRSSLIFVLLICQTGFAQTPRKVKVAEVQSVETARVPHYSGTIRSARRANLGFSVPARLARRDAEVGMQVKAGARLARLDSRQFENAVAAGKAQLAQVDAQLNQAQLERERVKRLTEAKAATLEELEAVNARYESALAAQNAARASLDESQRMLSECELRAPFAGTVAAVSLQVGEFAAPGVPVVTLMGEAALEIEIEVPESMIAALQTGMKVDVKLPLSKGKRVSGTIQSPGRAASQLAGRLYPVLIALASDSALSPGMTAEVSIPIQAGTALAVPIAAVINPGGGRPSVLCVREGKVVRIRVQVDQLIEEKVVIEGELTQGDQVIVGGHAGLIEGDSVEVVL